MIYQQLNHSIIIVTGGSGLLGTQHCKAIKNAGGVPIIWDLVPHLEFESMIVDVTNKGDIWGVMVRYSITNQISESSGDIQRLCSL